MSSTSLDFNTIGSGSPDGSTGIPSPIATGIPVIDSVERELCCLLHLAVKLFKKLKSLCRRSQHE